MLQRAVGCQSHGVSPAQCVPFPIGLNTTTLAKHLPLTTALAVALNKNTTCTRYIPSYGQCGGSAGSCYGADCLVSKLPLYITQAMRWLRHFGRLLGSCHKPKVLLSQGWYQKGSRMLSILGGFP